jgi:predicted CoA-binding protein
MGEDETLSSSDLARTRSFLDLAEGRGPMQVADDAEIESVLRSTKRIAVVGASSKPERPSLGVFRFLIAAVAADAGLVVVMDRCTAIEVGRIGGRR